MSIWRTTVVRSLPTRLCAAASSRDIISTVVPDIEREKRGQAPLDAAAAQARADRSRIRQGEGTGVPGAPALASSDIMTAAPHVSTLPEAPAVGAT